MGSLRAGTTKRPRRLLTAAALTFGLLAVEQPAGSQNFGGSHDRYFTVEWRLVEDMGRPTVAGYVRNEWNTYARNIQVRVVELGAGGQPADTVIASAHGEASPGGRVFFKAPVRSRSAAYQVSIYSFAWVHRGR